MGSTNTSETDVLMVAGSKAVLCFMIEVEGMSLRVCNELLFGSGPEVRAQVRSQLTVPGRYCRTTEGAVGWEVCEIKFTIRFVSRDQLLVVG